MPHSAAVMAPPSHRDASMRAHSVLDLIGHTPLLDVTALAPTLAPQVRICAKLEGFNPGGRSRIAPRCGWCARVSRAVRCDPARRSSTRLGQHRHRAGDDRRGARLSGQGGDAGQRQRRAQAGHRRVRRPHHLQQRHGGLRRRHPALLQHLADLPDDYFKPDQYNNPFNPQAHVESTGPEIWDATGGRVTHFVASIGTGGTVMGTGRYLKVAQPRHSDRGGRARRCAARARRAQAHGELDRAGDLPRGGARHEGAGADRRAYELVYQLGVRFGLIVGQSSGAALYAARRSRPRHRTPASSS